jgi:hypothetical protein
MEKTLFGITASALIISQSSRSPAHRVCTMVAAGSVVSTEKEFIMNGKRNYPIKLLALGIALLIFIGFANLKAHAGEAQLAQATFYVS